MCATTKQQMSTKNSTGVVHNAKQLLEFARPHTILGTSLATLTFYFFAALPTGTHDIPLLLTAWMAGLCVNVFVVGINQVYDIDIDRINKPYLPLAAGTMSMETGKAIVTLCGFLTLILAYSVSNTLLITNAIVSVIGASYSVPPLRFKTIPVMAATCITVARAIVFHTGLFITFSEALTGEVNTPAFVKCFLGFMTLFAIVISLMKDVPDIEGDRKHNIPTYVRTLGAVYVMNFCRVLLSVAYFAMIVAALTVFENINVNLVLTTHVAALASVWLRAVGCDDCDSKQSYSYYMFLWKLFYLEFTTFVLAVYIEA